MVSSSGGFETEVDCKVEDDETKDEDEVVVVLSDIADVDADANNFFFGITIFCFSFCDGVVAGGGILLSVEVEVLGIETGTEVELVEVEVEDTVSSGRDGAGVDNWIDDDELLDFVVGYSDIIKDPRDLHSIRSNSLKYRTIEQFEDDIKLMFQNCIVYNTHTGDKIFVNVRSTIFSKFLVLNYYYFYISQFQYIIVSNTILEFMERKS